jgi:hypothetical protein
MVPGSDASPGLWLEEAETRRRKGLARTGLLAARAVNHEMVLALGVLHRLIVEAMLLVILAQQIEDEGGVA